MRTMAKLALGLAAVAGAAAGAIALVLAGAAARKRRRERRTVCAETQPPEACAEEHERKVRRIAGQLKARKSKKPVSLQKRAVSHQVPKRRDERYADEKIDISDLNAILSIDPIRQICVAEPGVTFFDLVPVTLRYGLVPIVVPELKTITIGGAVAGCSLESMSFKHGGFHDTCLEYEVITASGEVLLCSPGNENRLIFQMMHGSFGTVGILSKLTFKLVPAKPYVKVRYERYSDIDAYVEGIRRHMVAEDVDFMDGILFSPGELMLSLGTFVDRAPYTHSYYWVKPYFETTRERTEDYLKTPDYFWRYDIGVTNPTPRSPVARFFLGKFLGSSQLLWLGQKLRFVLSDKKPNLELDVFIPARKAHEFMEWYARELNYFPLWCVPYRRVHDYEWVTDRWWREARDDLLLDLALYGMKQRSDRNDYKVMEDKLLELGGIKTLIAHNYYSEADFWKTWNRENYRLVKERTDPHNIFRDLYTKTCRAAMGAPPAAPAGSRARTNSTGGISAEPAKAR